MTYGQNMKLITSAWVDKNTGSGYKTLKMIPVTDDCPYVEVLCDRSEHGVALAIVSKLKKQNLHKVERLTDSGDPEPAKHPRPNGKRYKEQRVTLETFQEYYLMDTEEQVNFIKEFAVNAKDFDYDTFLKPLEKSNILQNTEEQSTLVDANGQALKKVETN